MSLIDEAIESWDRAEKVIKKTENVMIDSYFPAVLELRYAGRALISAWKEQINKNNLEVERFCVIVRHNARCAEHDAVDGLVLFVKKVKEGAAGRFGEEHLASRFNGHKELASILSEIDQDVVMTRGNHAKRPDTYCNIQEQTIDRLIELYEGLRKTISDLSDEDNEIEEKLKQREAELIETKQDLSRSEKINIWAIAITVLSMVTTIYFASGS